MVVFFFLIHFQGLLHLDDIGSQHDPHLRIMGGRHDTLKGHNIHILHKKKVHAS